jgi:hypothetical protein
VLSSYHNAQRRNMYNYDVVYQHIVRDIPTALRFICHKNEVKIFAWMYTVKYYVCLRLFSYLHLVKYSKKSYSGQIIHC